MRNVCIVSSSRHASPVTMVMPRTFTFGACSRASIAIWSEPPGPEPSSSMRTRRGCCARHARVAARRKKMSLDFIKGIVAHGPRSSNALRPLKSDEAQSALMPPVRYLAGMETRFKLPDQLVEGASINGNEYGWPIDAFPEAARRAESLGYACIGGQFQFRADVGVCEMYWLAADSSERKRGEAWPEYRERSRAEVMDKFTKVVSETDFLAEAMKWPVLKRAIEKGYDVLASLVFVAYFEGESDSLA